MRTSTNKLAAVIENENARLRGDLLTLAKRFSHDLRTPLGGIISTTEAIKEVLNARDPSAVPLADSLLASAEEIAQLIKQASFVARASASPQPKTSIHMADAVFPALQRVESRVLKREAVVVEPPSWPVIPGVMAWLEMIWWHLLMNALRHGGQKCRINLGWESQGAFIRFSISDNGPGVAGVVRGKLFKEFHRLHEEPDVPGLGLSVVQRLVELQGGACGYEEAKQGGACFFFTLPAEGGELRANAKAAGKSA
jgi:K+-sensing histidine kinase KdpD